MFGWRRRIGYISPGALEISVYDFYQIAPEGVGLVALSLPIGGWEVGEYSKNLEPVEDAAAYLARRHVHMIVHAGAPPVASRGAKFMSELVDRMTMRTGLPASTALHSAISAFATLGAQRVAVVTPFPPETHANILAVLEEVGLSVVLEERLDADFMLLHEISPQRVYDFVTSAIRRGGPTVDAAYVPCPQWHVFEMVRHLEGATGVPIVTSDGGDFWYAFRELEIHDAPAGHGILLDGLRR
ncbi:MAG: maleate cis-trans isomerase family protein [Acidimicrobiales bacterium]